MVRIKQPIEYVREAHEQIENVRMKTILAMEDRIDSAIQEYRTAIIDATTAKTSDSQEIMEAKEVELKALIRKLLKPD